MNQRKWLEVIDPEKITLYPIQFANCNRLDSNNAVFIFDEVGSGKTISSGLMALNYLEQNPEESVLIITTNALCKGGEGNRGQFLNDWFEKLPFKEMGFEDNIHIINNHYRNIEKNIKEYGLIIIDEAHLFIKTDTRKYKQLINLKSKKVVFLTATPIKHSEQDLQVYIDIANEILLDKCGISFETLKYIVATIDKKPEELISSIFNTRLPVTRYFKDTIQDLNIDNFEKEVSKRYHTLIENFKVDYNNYRERETLRVKALVDFIEKRLKEIPDSRFVIFTRLVKKEAHFIADYLKEHGKYKEFGSGTSKTYAKVTGENGWELANYSGKTRNDKLPQVLIVSYQLAEQGINLPGYNHIINYHVPAFPASLEQRYGRIDRLTKDGYDKIFNCFILSEGYYGTNEENFGRAVSISLHNLLKYLPSRNVVLSKTTLQNYLDISEHQQDINKKLKDAVGNLETVKIAFDFYIEQEKQQILLEVNSDDEVLVPQNNVDNASISAVKRLEDVLERENEDVQRLISILEDEDRFEIDSEGYPLTKLEYERELNAFKKFLEKIVENLLSDNKQEEKRRRLAKDLLEKNDNVFDDIFYKKKNVGEPFEMLATINAIRGCSHFIKTSEKFISYKKEFINLLTNTYIFNKIKKPVNGYFEKMFLTNEFNQLFPYISGKTYYEIIENAFDNDNEVRKFISEKCNKDERVVLLKEIDSWIDKLPIFIYFREISSNLCKASMTKNYKVIGTRQNYSSYNHFIRAIKYINEEKFNLGNQVIEEIKSFRENPNEKLKIVLIANGLNVYTATNWLKIIYQGSRKEVYAETITKEHEYSRNHYIFKYYEDTKRRIVVLEKKYPQLLIIKNGFKNKDASDVAILDRIIVDVKIDSVYEKELKNLEVIEAVLGNIACYRSLFSHLLFAESGGIREWIKPFSKLLSIPKGGELYVKDYWSKGILYELQHWKMKDESDIYSQYKIPKYYTKYIK